MKDILTGTLKMNHRYPQVRLNRIDYLKLKRVARKRGATIKELLAYLIAKI